MLTMALLFSNLSLADSAHYNFCYFKWNIYAASASEDKAPQTPVGLAVDVLAALSQRLDVQIALEEMPYKRCVAQVAHNSYDGALYYVPEIEPKVIPLEPSFMGHYAVFVVPENSHHQSYQNLEQFSGETVAILRGGSSIQWLQQNPTIDFYRTNRVDYLWPMLRGNRVSSSILDWVTLTWSTRVRNINKVRILLPIARYVPTHIGLAPKRKGLSLSWGETMQELIDSGKVDQVYEKHLGINQAQLKQRAQLATKEQRPGTEATE